MARACVAEDDADEDEEAEVGEVDRPGGKVNESVNMSLRSGERERRGEDGGDESIQFNFLVLVRFTALRLLRTSRVSGFLLDQDSGV